MSKLAALVTPRVCVSVLACMSMSLSFACASGKAAHPSTTTGTSAAPQTDGDVARGQVVFQERCDRCHPGGEARIGPTLKTAVLPGPIKRESEHSTTAPARHILPDDDFPAVMAFLHTLQVPAK